MDVILSTKSQQTPGPDLVVDCPRCGAAAAPASSYEQRDQLTLFFVIPLFALTNTFVVCGACGARLDSQLKIDELDQYSRGELSGFLAHNVSFVAKFLAITSVLLFCVPFVGLLLGAIGYFMTRTSGGWARKVSLIGLILSALASFFVVLMLIAVR